MEKMTCTEFFFGYMDDYNFATVLDDMYWRDAFSSEKLFDLMQEEAKEKNIDLVDVDTFDYDTFFYNTYKESELGLS